ncbi:uncharacterized protein MELLADRAFT_124304 [Melampsora larici-populina 98AG31]|uniref:Secreted protein n=1 Tax=Melampsora larici-populina (strain 98AG31 / pathotype 3-4-7) TaxID=747676 RepID=F4RPH4_MELLP|nr:uncharacterized protein MELLADRAFT_124304 [Melampsora larici-populina 98AG31]EGG05719.1 secreted protein [Melampsora larici-populina 98AG31]
MVKIKSTPIFQAVLLLLKHTNVIAVPIIPSTTHASAPISPEFFHGGLTNRRMMIKSEQVSRELTPTVTSPPPTQFINRVYPNEAQERAIKHAMRNQQRGLPYRVSTNGEMTEEPKDACDPSYFCGKMTFRNEKGELLDETGRCHCNSSCCGVRASNSAETLICCGILCGSIGTCPSLWCSGIYSWQLWNACKGLWNRAF